MALINWTDWYLQNRYSVADPNAQNNYNLNGLAGSDTLSGGNYNDTLLGGSGNDALSGLGGQDSLNGEDGNDVLNGGDGNDTLVGGAGNDTLDGGIGSDSMVGGAGDDLYYIDNVLDSIAETLSNASGGGIDTIDTRIALDLSVNALLNIDHARVNSAIATTTQVNLTGNSLANTLTGHGGSNVLSGGLGNDSLVGLAGDDTLDGGAGADTLVGGVGNDVYVIDNVGDRVTETLTQAQSGGIDTVRTSIALSLFDTQFAQIENVELLNTVPAGSAMNLSGNALDNRVTGHGGVNELRGGAGGDTLLGLVGDDTLLGEDGNDSLEGGDGNDMLEGGAGIDTLAGGAGDDVYVLSDPSDRVIETLTQAQGGGIDTVRTAGGLGLDGFGYNQIENAEVLSAAPVVNLINLFGNALNNRLTGHGGVNELRGAGGNDDLFGLGGNDTLKGEDGHDTLDGGAGDDLLIGGEGADVYMLGEGNDTIVETGLSGRDEIRSSTNVSLTSYVGIEDLVLIGGAITGEGDGGANVLQGNSLNNVMDGGAGNDTLRGFDGADQLRGGSGADMLEGGVGDDRLDGGAGNDNLNGGAGKDELLGGNGHDTLDGGADADTLSGGTGNDYYIVDAGDVVREVDNNPGMLANTDTIATALDNYVLNQRNSGGWGSVIESLELRGTAITGTGNELDNLITGNASANRLYGQNGNDTLIGGAGDDTLDGGLGDDTYNIEEGNDVIDEGADGGNDTVITSRNHVLTGTQLENVTLTSMAVSATGNERANLLKGNAQANTLTGAAGDDTLEGAAGNDTLVGGDGHDRLDGGSGSNRLDGGAGDDIYVLSGLTDEIVEGANGGTDTVVSSMTYSLQSTPVLSSHIENLTLAGGGHINGTGNALNNRIEGNSGDNLLKGEAGQDTLIAGDGVDTLEGGTGDDVYVLGSEEDTIIESSGRDTVQTSFSYSLATAANIIGTVEDLTLLGSDDVDATGDGQSNRLTGNAGANVLDGGSSAAGSGDTMQGGLGNDTYIVDSLLDVVLEDVDHADQPGGDPLPAGDFDLIRTSVNLDLATGGMDGIEAIELTGSATSARGQARDNVLIGSELADNMWGRMGNDLLVGGLGNDSLYGDQMVIGPLAEGMTDNDTLDGGEGGDIMIGGYGDDTYYVNAIGDAVIEHDGGGFDTVYSTLSVAFIAPQVESLVLIGEGSQEARGNSAANMLYGSDEANLLSGFAGNDLLVGQWGQDTLDGGAGDDTLMGGGDDDVYILDSLGDVVIEDAGYGTDTVRTALNDYTLHQNVERLEMSGQADQLVRGNILDNIIVGNDLANQIEGGDGDDELQGWGGSDGLRGGYGNDTLVGGEGGDGYLLVANAQGFGQDVIRENGQDSGPDGDQVGFFGLRYDQLWFSQQAGGDDLIVSQIGTENRVTVEDWFTDPTGSVEQFLAVESLFMMPKVLDAGRVQGLVDAMAAMSPPPMGQTDLSDAQRAQLAGAFGAAWQ